MKKRKNVYESVATGGLDVHYKFSSVTMRDAQGKVVRRERLDHRDRPALRGRLAAWPKGVPLVLEASFGWGWLSEEMQGAGLRPELSNCYKVEQMRKARGWAKTNRKDADLLSLLPLESGDWWRVWRAPADVRDRREWMRMRADLVQVQTQTKNRIHAIFQRHGVFHDFSDLFGAHGREFLAELCRTGRTEQVSLPTGAWGALRAQVALLLHVRGQLAAIAWRLRGQLKRSDLARRLDGIAGFGLILTHTLMAEIGQIERFRDHRALASYCLLAPVANDTGESDGEQAPLGRRLGHRGNRTLKWAFLEAARGAVRHGGKWRKIWDAYTKGGTKNCNRGYIKVGRELVTVVDVVWRKGVEYTETPPARPGSERGRARRGALPQAGAESPSAPIGADDSDKTSRSGTGQSSRPMAVVRR